MKYVFCLQLFILFFTFPKVLRAQEKPVLTTDKTLAKIMAMPGDTNKLNVYFKYVDTSTYLRDDHAQFLQTSSIMDFLAEKLHADKYILEYYFLRYHYYARINNRIAGYDYIKRALALAQKLDDKESIVHALNHIAELYLFMVENPKALETYHQALSTAKKIKNKDIRNITMASVLTRTAKFYSVKYKKYNEALKYNEQAVALLKTDTVNFQVGYAYAQLAKDNFNIKQYLPAYNYCQLYFKTKTVSDLFVYSDIFNTLGNIYSNAPDRLLTKMGVPPAQRFQKATASFNRSIELSKKDDDYLPNISNGLKDLSELYGSKGDFKKAYLTYKAYIVDLDSLENQAAKKTLLQMELNIEFHKQTDSLKFKELLTGSQLHTKQVQSYYFIGGIIILLTLSFFVFRSYRKADFEKHRSDNLLLNILPADVAEELKEKGSANARMFEEVTVIFTDFVNFTTISERLTPQELVDELNHCFKAFDSIIDKNHIEKIKTIGDAYLAVAGLPNADIDHAGNAVNAALQITRFIKQRKEKLGDKTFDVRVGVHSGSVVAGIVGVKKFAYDIWGDTVNTAARMEQNSEPGKVNVSEKTYEMIKDKFSFTYRGEIEAKNKGALKMYFADEMGEQQLPIN